MTRVNPWPALKIAAGVIAFHIVFFGLGFLFVRFVVLAAR